MIKLLFIFIWFASLFIVANYYIEKDVIETCKNQQVIGFDQCVKDLRGG